ncbi:MAG: hypothetical protein CMD86_03545 [Gammaproteobacteria bacterium]|nr:hypothetical protein [Gammaproteobacteria bacterium]HAH67787.1 hypothetical protein [Gammaproteobacteria bacterium]|tara:strand:- start:550 stop:1149 length:600 start_codon:yes stop_codon:yes gene_type:complete
MSKVSKINESIEKWSVDIESRNLEEAVEESSIEFRDKEQGVEVLAFAATIRALGLSNRDLQPRKLSNYIRSGYLQIQIICSVILFQFRGDRGVSRDDLYDSVCDVFPATTFANFRKVLATGVESEIFIREKDSQDSRRTIYRLSEEMLEPLTVYFSNTVKDFDSLFSSVFHGALGDEDINNLEKYIARRMSMKPMRNNK